MSETIHEPWQVAVREQNAIEMERLLREQPALAHEAIVFTRGNGTTYRRLPLCVSNENFEIARFLIEAGADVNGADPDGGGRPLSGPTLEVGELLITHGADINAFGYEHLTPLAYGAYVGDLPWIEHLISCGADVNRAHPAEAISPLHYAATRCTEPVLRALLAAGADPQQPDAQGRTALQWATDQSREPAILTLLSGTPPPAGVATQFSDPVQRPLSTSRGPSTSQSTHTAGFTGR